MVPTVFAEEFGIDIDWDPVSITASLKTPEKPEKANPKPRFHKKILILQMSRMLG